jgi:cardiolipin synthase (CMP-forming)
VLRLTGFPAGGYSAFEAMTSRTLTPANQITILRLVFVPLFAILEVERHYHWALGVLAAAAISDIVDGTVARVFKQESALGIALDPIADKVLMASAFILLSYRDVLPWWVTILVLSRDVAMVLTALLISLVAGYRPFRPTELGKVSTLFQIATLFAGVSFQVALPLISLDVVRVFVFLTAFFTVASGLHYLMVVQQRYAEPPAGSDAHSAGAADPKDM